jgi:phosphoenolpyruvate carboxykinase (ATP)
MTDLSSAVFSEVFSMAIDTFALPHSKRVLRNPSATELNALAGEMPNARRTADGNVNVQTRVLARSKGSTFLVSDEPIGTNQVMSRADYERMAAIQDAYIADREMILVEGWIGSDPAERTGARLFVEASNANIAGMQQQLYFPLDDEPFAPELTVIYTPNLQAEGWPSNRLIAVDLEQGVTRVFESDYFGESKKGGLRMWNRLVYERGGLPLHAGCKVIPTPRGDRVGLIVGLSGTGKTTTTFTRQNGSLPVQDDFVAWLPNGRLLASEAGCFAKTFALSAEDEPTIHGAVKRPEAYLENVSQDDDGNVDFFDTSYTQNGRATFSFSAIEHADARLLERAHFLLILNRNENIIPAVARLSGPQAAAYFMLGETQGTSAGGAEEAGKFLRVPGTNPFFPAPHDLQGNRFHELMERFPLEVYIMNTGRVGGPESAEGSRKVRIPHSSAIVKGIAEGTIGWQRDPDFGYEVAASVPGLGDDDVEVLQPRRLYDRLGRAEEYRSLAERFRAERREYLAKFPALGEDIIRAV